MASTQEQRISKTQTSNMFDTSTENKDTVTPEDNIKDVATDPGKGNASCSANDTVERPPEQIKEEKKKILTQVEYYFSDQNLPNDKFLNEVRSKNPEGWVPLKMICKFKKMQVYKDYDLIIEALRESPSLLEVDKHGEHVRRKTLVMIDIPQHIKDSAIWRSIYVKGFDKDNIDSNYEKEVASFFSQHGKVEKSFARREDGGTYKDSFFIQFSTHDEAMEVTKMDLSYKNEKLSMMMKFDYCEKKCIEKGLDPNTMRLQRQQQPVKKEKRNHKSAPGCLVYFEGAGPNSTYSTIRTQVHNNLGDVRYVQYDPKNSYGVIEFEHPIARKLIESAQFEKVTFDGVKPKLRALEGDEEKNYYLKRRNENFEKSRQSIALKAEFGISPEENNNNNNSNTNVRRDSGTKKGRKNGRKFEKQPTEFKIKTDTQDEPDNAAGSSSRSSIKVKKGKRKAEKQLSESGDQKIKIESQDGPDDAVAGGQPPTKKSRVGDVVPEVLPSSSERKRKAKDPDTDRPQRERPKSPKLDLADE